MSYGRLMLDIAGSQLSQQEIQLLQNPQVGGLILFARNIESPEQVAALLAEVRAVNEQLLIAVDQAGGETALRPSARNVAPIVSSGHRSGLKPDALRPASERSLRRRATWSRRRAPSVGTRSG